MNNQDNYYIAMSDEAFNEIKKGAIEIWKTYSDEYGYQSGKIERIKDIQNIEDNALYIIAMFDIHNIRKLLNKLSKETIGELKDKRLPLEYF